MLNEVKHLNDMLCLLCDTASFFPTVRMTMFHRSSFNVKLNEVKHLNEGDDNVFS